MKIIVDAMGGDHAPREIVLGAIEAAEKRGIEICLVGRGEAILAGLHEAGIGSLPDSIELYNASETVDMEDDPASVMREKKDSSMAVGLRLLAEGYGDAFASAGSTGALLTGSTLTAKRIRGIRRAALGTSLPCSDGSRNFLLDCGANVECTPEYLLQFAYMGSFVAERLMGKPSPRVGLLNIGTEPTKGTLLQRDTYKLLEEAGAAGRLNFTGNLEAREVMSGCCDVIVADGYSGNILLKSMEGMGLLFKDLLKGMFYKNLGTKISALIVKNGLDGIKKMMDYKEIGGAPLLGIAMPVFKIHGSAKADAVSAAIGGAKAYAESGIIEAINDNMEYMRVE